MAAAPAGWSSAAAASGSRLTARTVSSPCGKALAAGRVEQAFERRDLQLRLDQGPAGVEHDVLDVVHHRACRLRAPAGAGRPCAPLGRPAVPEATRVARRRRRRGQEPYLDRRVEPLVGELLQPELGLAQVERTDERAAALFGRQQAAVDQDGQRAPQRHGADVELGAELRLRGQLVAGPVLASGDASADDVDDALVGALLRLRRSPRSGVGLEHLVGLRCRQCRRSWTMSDFSRGIPCALLYRIVG